MQTGLWNIASLKRPTLCRSEAKHGCFRCFHCRIGNWYISCLAVIGLVADQQLTKEFLINHRSPSP